MRHIYRTAVALCAMAKAAISARRLRTFAGVFACLAVPCVAKAAVQEVVFRVGANASIDWFEIDNPAVRGTLRVTNAPYAASAQLNAAAVDVARNRLMFDDNSATTAQGYAISLAGLQLIQNAATPVTVTSLGAWDSSVEVDTAGYRKTDGQVYYYPRGTDQLRTLTFGPTGSITGFTNVGKFNGASTPSSITGGDIDFAADGSIWASGNNESGTSTLWNFNASTLNTISSTTQGSLYNGITFNAAGDTLYGYHGATGQYGIINRSTGGFQTVLDTDQTEFGVTGDLATGTLTVVVPEPASLAFATVAFASFAVARGGRRRRFRSS